VKRLLGCVAVLLVAGGLALAGPTEEEKIEAVLAAVIDAYRAGDYTAMGQYYAADVTMVSGDYNPPVVGWKEAETRYRQIHTNLAGVELIRENTRITRRGNFAWAVYQWRFAAMMGKEGVAAVGHTTLLLEKRRGHWIIVHNHTSALMPPPAPEKPAPKSP
jgi:uncharacterized protein (TIGR02246 family)